MIIKIVGANDPVLRMIAKPVKKIDKKILALISDMKDTLYAQNDPEGIGLAAPQIGKSLQIFITNYEDYKLTIINPKIINIGKAKVKSKEKLLEGCLSLPHYYGPLSRANKITIKYLDEKNNEITKEFTGFISHVIQHEIDHLKGKLFTDHIVSQSKPLYKFDGDEWEEVELK